MSYTLGVAMIARNGGKMMKAALKPFVGKVDEIAVVFGGKSNDNTEYQAKKYATKTAHYDGPLGDNGELLDFADARQQSFDLCNTDWVIVVDTDDEWSDVGEVRGVIDRMPDKEKGCIIWVPYSLGEYSFHQPRIFRRESGQWESRIHEEFKVYDEWFDATRFLSIKTNATRVRQQSRPDEMSQDRLQQNIKIGNLALAENPKNYRTANQLTNDYIVSQDYENALSVTNHYLETWAADPDKKYDDDLSHLWAKRGIAQINTGDYPSAVLSEIWALGTFERGSCWTYLSEALLKMGMSITEKLPPDGDPRARSEAIFDLAIFATDRALNTGRSRTGYADDVTLTTYKPLAIKAMALLGKNDPHRALKALDLGLAIKPDEPMLMDLQAKVANSIGEVL